MFWEKLPKPFFALAPMEDVTDTVFRQMVARYGKPEVFFTEFINVDGLIYCSSDLEKILFGSTPPTVPSKIFSEGPALLFRKNKFLQRLVYTEGERPIVAQIWGSDPEKFRQAAEIIKKLGFDGIDINMGCPQRVIMKCGGGGALIGDDVRVGEIIQATKEGSGGLPVSVKTRIGNRKIITEDWIGFLLEQKLVALTVHGRTVAEQSRVPAHWDEIGKVVEMSRKSMCKCKIIGNGDVKDRQEGEEKAKEYGVDGIMIGRGIFSNISAFNNQYSILNTQNKIEAFKEHQELWEKTWGKYKSKNILKKFVKTYINGFDGAIQKREEMYRLLSSDTK